MKPATNLPPQSPAPPHANFPGSDDCSPDGRLVAYPLWGRKVVYFAVDGGRLATVSGGQSITYAKE